ncbi:threonine-phosphate decarboxylase CobD [Bacillus tianshenii]|nr:threonine-phosphate decarboxylase CobD [Bacillus tianshenii]
MTISLPEHGANTNGVYNAFDIKYSGSVLDFSVNTNPFGMPESFNELLSNCISAASHYPELDSITLRKAIGDKEKLDPSNVLIGNGAAECIFLITRYFMNKRVGIIEPTFTEYRLAAKAYQCSVESFQLNEDGHLELYKMGEFLKKVDVLFCCHPNNPTGMTYGDSVIHELCQLCEEYDTYLVLDEAFYDFAEQNVSAVHLLRKYSNLLILRSFTKMFHIPGIRLGYVLGHAPIVQALASYQPPWSVNTLAQQIGMQCLEEGRFVEETKKQISYERERVLNRLEQMGFTTSKSVVNYYLLSHPQFSDMKPLLTFLLQQGIVARHTYNFQGLNGKSIRLAIKRKDENDTLLRNLEGWLDQC